MPGEALDRGNMLPGNEFLSMLLPLVMAGSQPGNELPRR